MIGELKETKEYQEYIKIVKKFKVYSIIAVIAGIIIYRSLVYMLFEITPQNNNDDVIFAYMALMLFGALPYMFVSKHKNINLKDALEKFARVYKKNVITLLIQDFDKTLSYEPEMGLDQSEFESLGVFKKPDFLYKSTDKLSGKADDISFSVYDIHAQRERRIGKRNNKKIGEDVFKGEMYVFTMKDSFKYDLYIGHWIVGKKILRLDNPTFMKEFPRIACDNSNEAKMYAYFILSQSFMEKLIEIKKQREAEVFVICKNDKMYLGVNDKSDKFEPVMDDKKMLESLQAVKDNLEQVIELGKMLNIDEHHININSNTIKEEI
jgi:hypothetical protein